MTAIVEPQRIAKVMGLRAKINSLEDLLRAVEMGLPKSSLEATLAQVFRSPGDATALMGRVIPPATYHRRGRTLKPQESERTERLARVVATAQFVWDDKEDARAFLTAPHTLLEGKPPIEVALTELGARRVENLLWSLFYGLPA